MNAARSLLFVVGCLVANPTARAAELIPNAAASSTFQRERLAEKQLLFSFQGKGSSLAWDAGVVKRAYENIAAVRDNRVIVSGNSSGSILAAYFSCFGFSKTSVDYAAYRLQHANIDAIRGNENGAKKAGNLLLNQPTEISPNNLKEYIGFALGVNDCRSARDIAEIVRRSRVAPRYPLMIVAANGEVLDNRAGGNALSSKDLKEFDPTNFSVSWKPDVFEFYRSRPAQFAKENPNLRLGGDAYIGKACTCFVDQSMYNLLSRIPAAERLWDLRLVKTPADLALAIQASTAEPSYFPPVPEMDYSKLLTGDVLGQAGNTRRRSYAGGFIISLVAQDARRMLPELRVLGTGVARVPLPGRELVKSWYLIDLQQTANLSAWWSDLEVSIPRDVQQAIVDRSFSSQQEFEAGYRRAGECFAADRGVPQYVCPPRFDYPAQAAIVPSGSRVMAVSNPARPAALQTLRGLGLLLNEAGE